MTKRVMVQTEKKETDAIYILEVSAVFLKACQHDGTQDLGYGNTLLKRI